MLVISSTSFMLYGECGVWFTTYNINNNTNNNNMINIINILPRNTITSCTSINIKNNSIIYNILNNLYYIYINNNGKEKIMEFKNKNNITIAYWSNIKIN